MPINAQSPLTALAGELSKVIEIEFLWIFLQRKKTFKKAFLQLTPIFQKFETWGLVFCRNGCVWRMNNRCAHNFALIFEKCKLKAFPLRGRCRACRGGWGVAKGVMNGEKQNFNLFPPHPSTASLASLHRVDTFPSRGRLWGAVRTKMFKLCAFLNYSSTALRSPFSRKRRLIYAILSVVDW